MKITKELAAILNKAAKEVASWPKWKRSLDPIGEAGRIKYKV